MNEALTEIGGIASEVVEDDDQVLALARATKGVKLENLPQPG